MDQSDTLTGEELHELLQETYFDNVDGGDAETAVTALAEDVEWVHTQVWEHDGHTSQRTDVLHGREAVFEFLDARVGEMQDVGIQHRVRETVVDESRGAFRAEVVGPGGNTEPFMGWVTLSDGIISEYVVAPERMSE